MELLRQFKPALIFVGKFILIYFIGNIIYGIYVESYGEYPDPITVSITRQTAAALALFNAGITSEINPVAPTVFLRHHADVVISVFEGCNGVNVLIVFVAFIFAFGGKRNAMLWFIPVGFAIIHLLNLFRLGLLFELAESGSRHFHYFHKYVFTASLYVSVFLMWTLWITKFQNDVGASGANAREKS